MESKQEVTVTFYEWNVKQQTPSTDSMTDMFITGTDLSVVPFVGDYISLVSTRGGRQGLFRVRSRLLSYLQSFPEDEALKQTIWEINVSVVLEEADRDIVELGG
ncbi:hypothetical protein ACFLX5_03705 [Chloroflexota bacterium]